MMKFSRIGAAALALALSVTFLTPTSVLAATETKQELPRNAENKDDYDLVESTTTIVAGPFEDTLEGEEAMENAAISQGFVSTTYSGNWAFYKDGKGYYWVAGYSRSEDEDKIYIKKTTYTNTITGQTSGKEDDVVTRINKDSADYMKFQSSIRVKKGEVTYLAVSLKNGDTKIKSVKSSKKSIFTAKLYKKMYHEAITADHVDPSYDVSDDGTWTYYYYNSVGEKIILGNDKDAASYAAYEAALKATNGSSAVRYIKIEGKKVGKANLSFKITDAAATRILEKCLFSFIDERNGKLCNIQIHEEGTLVGE